MFAVLRLMRFDKPVGTLLLWWPTAWALWMANAGQVPGILCLWFALGTVLMRSAGCVINDIADRRIDLHVTRTASRPLTAGEVTLTQAWILLIGLLGLALAVLLQLPSTCFYYALAALCIVGTYPFCKRFLAMPQSILALAFSMGIPMAYVASAHPFELSMWGLVLVNIVWVLAYDTLYACVDQADDMRIGVHSTAVYWGNNTNRIVTGLHVCMQSIWIGMALWSHWAWPFWIGWVLGSANLCYQQHLMKRQRPEAYFQAFKINVWYGGWMWLGLVFNFTLKHLQ